MMGQLYIEQKQKTIGIAKVWLLYLIDTAGRHGWRWRQVLRRMVRLASYK